MKSPVLSSNSAMAYLQHLNAMGVSSVPKPLKPVVTESPDKDTLLKELAQEARSCRKCSLYKTRTHCVFSDGSSDAELMFIGEAPGRDEDVQGVPFVGAAGQLLTKMIQAMKLKRADVYICNVLKDRPPGNRTPSPEEMAACLPFLEKQIEIVQPRIICVLGSVAAKGLFGPQVSITRIRGQIMEFQGIRVVPTFHPAYLLRNPSAKTDSWKDLQLVMKLLAE